MVCLQISRTFSSNEIETSIRPAYAAISMEGVNRARFRLKGKTNMDPKRIGFHSHPDLNSEAGTSALSQISPRTPSVTHPSVKTPRKKWVIDVAKKGLSILVN